MSSIEISKLAYEGKAVEVKSFISKDPNLIGVKDDASRVPLHWVCAGGHTELANFLLDNGKDFLNVADDSGWTPLMIASSAGRTDVVKLLLKHMADVNVSNNTKQTPLHYAASKSHFDIARLLLENGADINARDKYGATPLHRASAKGNTKIVQLILADNRRLLNVADCEGNTPLHLACMEQHLDTAIALVKAGAHLDVQNKEEKTPLELAEPGIRKSLQRISELG